MQVFGSEGAALCQILSAFPSAVIPLSFTLLILFGLCFSFYPILLFFVPL